MSFLDKAPAHSLFIIWPCSSQRETQSLHNELQDQANHVVPTATSLACRLHAAPGPSMT